VTLAGVLPAGQYTVVPHVGPFGQLVEAVWWVTIVDSTLVRHHLEAYDGVLGSRAPEERQLVEGAQAGAALCHQPAADCLLTCGSSKRGSVRPDQKEMPRAAPRASTSVSRSPPPAPTTSGSTTRVHPHLTGFFGRTDMTAG